MWRERYQNMVDPDRQKYFNKKDFVPRQDLCCQQMVVAWNYDLVEVKNPKHISIKAIGKCLWNEPRRTETLDLLYSCPWCGAILLEGI